MNRLIFRALQWLLIAAFAISSTTTFANKPTVKKPTPSVVGNAVEIDISPDLSKATRTQKGFDWTKHINHPGASFIKLHFSDFNLSPGDTVTVYNAKNRVIDTLTMQGPKDRINFWGLPAQGDSTTIRFQFKQDYQRLPFRVDRMVLGKSELFAQADSSVRSVCGTADFDDAICFQNEPGKWDNVQASVGVMTMGGNAQTALFCSGSNVSADNRILTNQHCVENQGQCDNTDYVFKYYRTSCNVGAPATEDWQAFRCGEMLASEPLINCDAAPGDLDFALTTIAEGDPASEFGYAEIDTTPITSGEEIYIVQHPAGRPHEISIGSGSNVQVDGTVLRYFNTLDTEGGSSGSPIFRSADDKLIGLHHCGGCANANDGNRGMLITDILPSIQEFLCTDELTLRYTGTENLTEVTGNGDSLIEPGETWSFVVRARNASCATNAASVMGQVVLNSAVADNVILSDSTLNFGALDAGGNSVSAAVTFQVESDAVCGSDVIFDFVNLTDGGIGTNEDSIAGLVVPIGGVPVEQQFTDSFDQGVIQWSIVDNGTGTGPATTWTTSNPGNRSLTLVEPYMIVDSDELGPGQTMDEELISIAVDVSTVQNLTLQFTHDFNFYDGGQTEQADVDIRSSATGGQWQTVQNFTGADTSGVVTVDITAYKAADLQVRFHYYNATYEWWWAVDDVMLLSDDGFSCDIFGDTDEDGDGVTDSTDNCTLVANADQRDTNGDGYGNICDPDLNNDGIVNFLDISEFAALFNTTAGGDADLNGDGNVNFLDFAIFPDYFLQAPGPSSID